MCEVDTTEIPKFNADMLISAYAQGAFPMAEPDTGDIYWYCPDPRGILPLDGLHVSRSLARHIRRGEFEIRFDTAFETVMQACAQPREEDNPTWIDQRIIDAYCELHKMNLAHSVEAWQDNQLVGGLYGVSLNGLFAGESMFSRKSNASKFCLVHLVEYLNERGYQLFDVQFQNPHIAQFGVIEIPREQYFERLTIALETKVKWAD